MLATETPPIVLPPLHWHASPNHYNGRSQGIDLIVLHDTEGGYAGAVNWFANAHSQVSAHIVLKEDGSEATQMVHYKDAAWHCAAFNGRSIGIEMAGYFDHESDHQLRVAARIVGFFLHHFKIPAVTSDGRHAGYARHKDLGAEGGGHHDPFDDTVWLRFQTYVAREVKRGGYREVWGN